MKVIAAIEDPAVIKRILNIRHARRRNSHWPAYWSRPQAREQAALKLTDLDVELKYLLQSLPARQRRVAFCRQRRRARRCEAVDISYSCPTFQELMSQSARCIASGTVERTSIHQVRK